LAPFFADGSRQLKLFSARTLFLGADGALIVIFETVLFPLGEAWNKGVTGSPSPIPDQGFVPGDFVAMRIP